MKNVLLGLLLCLASSTTWAAACGEYNDLVDGVLLSRVTRSNECWLEVSPDLPPKLIYRDYLITDKGLMMIFNSYGEGPDSEMTGARVLFFFPRTEIPDVDRSGPDFVIHTASPNVVLHMDRKSAKLLGMEHGKVVEDPQVIPTNKGGVEFSNLNTVWMDSGFGHGHDPTSEKTHSSIFHGANGKSCTVKNTEVFDYVGNEVNLKFSTDAEVAKFVKTRCPQLTVNF